MDRKVVIRADNISKRYRLYPNPRARFKELMLSRFGVQTGRDHWALEQVSFSVNRGDAVGLIGRNGAGKTTLLQILAGTMAPSTGKVSVQGRTSALLGLGSGFNRDYSGRENVFLSAAILGIGREEIKKRFDSIAAFADIGSYMDQPVSTYSSGMFARLAFSLAVSLDPEILLVDEILSVGDVAFQQKCMARIKQMLDKGVTLMLVSHAPHMVRSICNKAIYLIKGRVAYAGGADQTVNLYLNHVRTEANREAINLQKDLEQSQPFRNEVPGDMRYGLGHVQIQNVEVMDDDGQPANTFDFGQWITITARIKALIHAENLSVSILVRDMTGVDLMGTTTFDEEYTLPTLEPEQEAWVRFRFRNTLRAGNFGVCLAINRVSTRDRSDNVLFDQVDACASFTVMPDMNRPVHYKFHCPMQITSGLLEGSAQPTSPPPAALSGRGS
jgi:lipopolysaccharide transport system ATP-binding protein